MRLSPSRKIADPVGMGLRGPSKVRIDSRDTASAAAATLCLVGSLASMGCSAAVVEVEPGHRNSINPTVVPEHSDRCDPCKKPNDSPGQGQACVL